MNHSEQDHKIIAAAMKRLEALRKQEAFDPINLESKPTPAQQEVLEDFGKVPQQWIRAGNQSGKSQVCTKVFCEVMEERHSIVKARREHPDVRQSWGKEPLLGIIAGRTGKQIEDSLLPKIRSYLTPGSYKEVRIGNIIQRLELTNGNRIIFQSLENPNTARERLMSYVAHITWVDELPPTMDLVREILVRTQARNGYALFSFTPTVVNVEIQRFVDSLTLPAAKVYRFKMLDNPLYSDPKRREEVMARYDHLPAHTKSMVFEGDWMPSDNMVYHFDYIRMVEMPQNYSPLAWRHVESVDPALKSALGLTVWAECPERGVWYCVLAEYIRGIYVPTELVETVKRKTSSYNVVRRISDPHEVWYIQTAASMGIQYQGVYKKNERKSELIKNLQEKLGSTLRLAPVACSDLIDELQTCRWSDGQDSRIVNASSYHLLDSAQYFADAIPRREIQPVKDFTVQKWHENLLTSHNKRLALETKAQEMKEKKKEAKIMRRARWR